MVKLILNLKLINESKAIHEQMNKQNNKQPKSKVNQNE
jgi:hypothetical protein